MNDQKIIKWALKEFLGYKHKLTDFEELQASLLTLADQSSNTKYGIELKNILLNTENKLEEIKYTIPNNLIDEKSLLVLTEIGRRLQDMLKGIHRE